MKIPDNMIAAETLHGDNVDDGDVTLFYTKDDRIVVVARKGGFSTQVHLSKKYTPEVFAKIADYHARKR